MAGHCGRQATAVFPARAVQAALPLRVWAQARFFARDPRDGSRRTVREQDIQNFRADQGRLRDAWAWVGWWEHRLEYNKDEAKKVRRKLHFPSEAPEGRMARQAQSE